MVNQFIYLFIKKGIYKMKLLIIVMLLYPFLSSAKVEKSEDSLKVYKTPSITITTNKAEERKSPVPFTEISESDIKRDYSVQDITKLMDFQPSILTYSQNGNSVGYINLNMRGFDQRRISVMVNGIPQNDPEDHNVYWVDFPDITESLENIQIQRGAGITSYGAAAIGGSINLTTSNFATRKSLKISSGIGWQKYGADGTKMVPNISKYLVEFSSGLTDNYAFYGRLSRVNTDGYRDRSFANLNSYFFSAVRFDDNLTTQINLFGGPFSDGLVYNGLPKSYIKDLKNRRLNLSYFAYDSTGVNILNDWTTQRRKQEVEEFSQPHYELLNDWTISNNLTFKSALFYYTGAGYYDYDAGWAASYLTDRVAKDYTIDSAKVITNSLVRAYVDNRQGGWIPRIIWKHENGQFDAGIEMRFHRSEHYGLIKYSEYYPQNYDPDYRIYDYNGIRNIFSVFAREQYNLTNSLLLNIEGQLVRQLYSIDNEKSGLKYTHYINSNNDTIGNGNALFNISYVFFNPRIGLNWNITENTNLYWMAAYTSREPQMGDLYSSDASYYGAKPLFEGKTIDSVSHYDFTKPLIKPESMTDIEIGYTHRDPNNYYNINLYWMEYRDELVKSGRLDIFGNPIDGNAPKTRHIGMELQASSKLLHSSSGDIIFTLNTTFSYNRILKYDYNLGNEQVVSLKDNPIAGFPDYLANFRLSYILDEFYFSLNAKFVGLFTTDNFGDLLKTNEMLIQSMQAGGSYYRDNKVDSYTLVNASLSYKFKDILTFKSLRLQMQVNNLLNNLFAAGGEGKEFFPSAERNIYLGVQVEL
jgi:iron complex outermembrane recepter protein